MGKYLVLPVKAGIVGTGYAAQRRAEALLADRRAQLVCVAGNSPDNRVAFGEAYGIEPLDSWQQLVAQPALDLVVICTINCQHGEMVRAALAAGKHVIVEYPLALDCQEAAALVALAKQQDKLLHVEHIELLGGLHRAIRQHLPAIGEVFYARYTTLQPQHPAPRRWTYHHDSFGFPLMAALSRLHRFTDLFGVVKSVSCQSRFWEAPETGYFTACLCTAQLRFASGLVADVTYGKGEAFWQGNQTFELHGEAGSLIFAGEKGRLISSSGEVPIAVESRRGLFAKDTQLVLDYLEEEKSLYVTPEASLYALQVGEAARESAKRGRNVEI
jgi:biliverdin reductase